MATIFANPLVIQAEDLTAFSILDDGTVTTDDDSLVRTRDQNQERHGLNGLGKPDDTSTNGDNNPGAPDFDDYGLRPDYTGTGYMDINGGEGEPKLAFTFDAEPGDYQVTVRVANGSGSQDRPIKLSTDVGDTAFQASRTGEWFAWSRIGLSD